MHNEKYLPGRRVRKPISAIDDKGNVFSNCTTGAARIIRVTVVGDGKHDGKDFDNAMTFEEAMESIQPGETMLIMSGTYLAPASGFELPRGASGIGVDRYGKEAQGDERPYFRQPVFESSLAKINGSVGGVVANIRG